MCVIPRSREVGQSYVTSIATTIYSLLFAAKLVWQQRPNLVSLTSPCAGSCALNLWYAIVDAYVGPDMHVGAAGDC